jgi:hypothetical protein
MNGNIMFLRRRRANSTSDNPAGLTLYNSSGHDADKKSSHVSDVRSSFQNALKQSRIPSFAQIIPLFGQYALLVVVAGMMIIFTLGVALLRQQFPSPSQMRPTTEQDLEDLQIVFSHHHYHHHHHLARKMRPFHNLRITTRRDDKEEYIADFGGLDFWFLDEQEEEAHPSSIFSRRIDPDDFMVSARARHHLLHSIDDKHFERIYEPDADLEDWDKPCQRNNWKEQHRYPTCNSVHEIVLERPPTSLTQDLEINYLGYVIR